MSKTYSIKLTGANPLLLHQDSIAWADKMLEWSKDPANKGKSVAGDDRSPAFRWIGCLYVENGRVVMPADNLMTMGREGGAQCPTGKKGATFKRLTQSGIIINESGWPLLVNGREVKIEPVYKLIEEASFAAHEEAIKKMGFMLFVKRVIVGGKRHIRVRPRFDQWSVSGTATVLDDRITTLVLKDIYTFAGRLAGLGDWRPSSKYAPGSFGTFTVEVAEIAA